MARNIYTRKYHEELNDYGWPLFNKTQTDSRLALCRAALCPRSNMKLVFKDIYENDLQIQSFARLRLTSRDDFTDIFEMLKERAWGGRFVKLIKALEGGFYPFVRNVEGNPVDSGAIWIGTRHSYPMIYVENTVANWICPYTKSGLIMTEPFDTLPNVLLNWERLANKKLYPCLSLEPVG